MGRKPIGTSGMDGAARARRHRQGKATQVSMHKHALELIIELASETKPGKKAARRLLHAISSVADSALDGTLGHTLGSTKTHKPSTPKANQPSVLEISKANDSGSRQSAIELAGMAIVANSVEPEQGTVNYSLDEGITWTPIPVDVSDKNALVLSTMSIIAYHRAPDFNGTPGTLTTRFIDTSNKVPLHKDIYARDLASRQPRAIAGVDVSGQHNGGATAVSSSTMKISFNMLGWTP